MYWYNYLFDLPIHSLIDLSIHSFIYLSIRISIHPYMYIRQVITCNHYIHLPIYSSNPINQFFYIVSTCTRIHSPIHNPSIHPFIHPSIHPSIHMYLLLSETNKLVFCKSLGNIFECFQGGWTITSQWWAWLCCFSLILRFCIIDSFSGNDLLLGGEVCEGGESGGCECKWG